MSWNERAGIIGRRVLSSGLVLLALSAGVHAGDEATKGNVAGATLAGIEGGLVGYVGVKSWNNGPRRRVNNEETVPQDTIIAAITADAENSVDLQEGVGYTVIPPTPQGGKQ